LALKPKKLGKTRSLKWLGFKVGTLSSPLGTEMMREQLPVPASSEPSVLESGVLAFRRADDGDPEVLLISRKRSKKWGIPKGKLVPTLNFAENVAKEAFEEAGELAMSRPLRSACSAHGRGQPIRR
jgi:NUDIX domain